MPNPKDTLSLVERLRKWHTPGETITGDVQLYLDAADEIERLTSQGGAEGYVLVPREPTGDMVEAARDWAQRDWMASGDPNGYLAFYDGLYRAMLSAAPQPPSVSSEIEREKLDVARSVLSGTPSERVAQRLEQAIPDGWVLVPREATKAMWDARFAADRASETGHASPSAIYSAMLSAAPSPPVQGEMVEAPVGEGAGVGAVTVPGCQWHDISTAPRDGTGFLYHADAPEGLRLVGSAYFDGYDFRDVDFFSREDEEPIIKPTHWMPLPPRPGDRTDASVIVPISAGCNVITGRAPLCLDNIETVGPGAIYIDGLTLDDAHALLVAAYRNRNDDRTDSGSESDGSLNKTSINAAPKPEGE